jgi:hypothetical protein
MATLDRAVSSGRMDLPDWFGAIHVGSWLGHPLGHRVERGVTGTDKGSTSLQLVFSDAGDAEHPVSDQSFDGWYEQHLRLKDTESTGPALPEWWDRVRFASWNLVPAR